MDIAITIIIKRQMLTVFVNMFFLNQESPFPILFNFSLAFEKKRDFLPESDCSLLLSFDLLYFLLNLVPPA
jgi:hypothetical protein